ncbi:4-alpha-glucanotransferase [Hyphomicrobium sp.]|uniref:4-alpha-glucanotransferase n=1 Tax=Hyphomicrobium sp. TaxID=82 RepID=UPI000FB63183|nr:4-alpha-glucanotransferase [Hyphomicrobium sp.]RUO98481.1 MAG: 4-alpha-glucanotransferase [Hyphomicrobium sp.]
MNDPLSRLSAIYGIEESYISATGEHRVIPDAIKISLLEAMGVDAAHDLDLDHGQHPSSSGSPQHGGECYVPDWLREGRIWGVSTQLYAISSRRNQGIGDFVDLANLAELAAARGADFVGVNPLHALFWDDPNRCSPYFPSTRQFINPLYIAIDVLPLGAEILAREDQCVQSVRESRTVDYGTVARLKHRALREIFFRSSARDDFEFRSFCEDRGQPLDNFARFETLSALMVERGFQSGWLKWSPEFQDVHSSAVLELMRDHQDDILWHKWLQWTAHTQLAEAQRCALAAGMRVGLYLDLAVGVAPDGAATWGDPALVTAKARIGCPPDEFNVLGQDWGLAPIIPSALEERAMGPFEEVIAASACYAGAVRIDHAMALERLYWIPEGSDARGGGYVRYPREEMLDVVARVSEKFNTIIIGEDLGTVPAAFRDRMWERQIHSYRVFYFERDEAGHYVNPESYPQLALACIGTHDLPTLGGWWSGTDIETRRKLGLIAEGYIEAELAARQGHRRQLLALLARNGFAHAIDHASATELADEVVCDLHACIAKVPSRLFVVQLEDIAGARDQINLPGTHKEYPNWRSKLPMTLEELFDSPLAARTLDAVARVRPRQP